MLGKVHKMSVMRYLVPKVTFLPGLPREDSSFSAQKALHGCMNVLSKFSDCYILR